MRKKKKGMGLFIVLVIIAALASGGIVFYALPLVINTGKYTHLIFFLLWIALSAFMFLGPKVIKKRRGGR